MHKTNMKKLIESVTRDKKEQEDLLKKAGLGIKVELQATEEELERQVKEQLQREQQKEQEKRKAKKNKKKKKKANGTAKDLSESEEETLGQFESPTKQEEPVRQPTEESEQSDDQIQMQFAKLVNHKKKN
jgi:hypothetical protein